MLFTRNIRKVDKLKVNRWKKNRQKNNKKIILISLRQVILSLRKKYFKTSDIAGDNEGYFIIIQVSFMK